MRSVPFRRQRAQSASRLAKPGLLPLFADAIFSAVQTPSGLAKSEPRRVSLHSRSRDEGPIPGRRASLDSRISCILAFSRAAKAAGDARSSPSPAPSASQPGHSRGIVSLFFGSDGYGSEKLFYNCRDPHVSDLWESVIDGPIGVGRGRLIQVAFLARGLSSRVFLR